MSDEIALEPKGITTWVRWQSAEPSARVLERCRKDHVQRALDYLGSVKVVSLEVNTSGWRAVEMPKSWPPSAVPTDDLKVTNLPPFCEVVVDVPGERHVAKVTVWVPLSWNGRFMGVLGGGNQTRNAMALPEFVRGVTLPVAIRNGFAAAETDGGNRDDRFVEWGLDLEMRDIDWELTENWLYRSTHDMAVLGKAVTQAIHGRAPLYSYAQGGSGGGRQALVEAQRYPGDFDGVWAADPGINWERLMLAMLWPPLVMKEERNALSPVKLEAFRGAAIAELDGTDGLRDGMISAFDPATFDALRVVGTETSDGVVTEADARVMNLIWRGPRTQDGDFLWFGLRPGTESWGHNFAQGGLCKTEEMNGNLEAVPFDIAEGFVRAWVAKDPDWDWNSLTYDSYEEMWRYTASHFASFGSNDPDLGAFHARGGKAILSHGGADQIVMTAGSIDYYQRVAAAAGSFEDTRSFIRLFISDGDGHGIFNDPGGGITVTDGMSALMEWVEQGEAPDEIAGTTLEIPSLDVKATRPIYAFPYRTRYVSGDPSKASSYQPERLDDLRDAAAVFAGWARYGGSAS